MERRFKVPPLPLRIKIAGATTDANNQQNNTGGGSVGSYQSSNGSPDSHAALSPEHSPHSHSLASPPQQNGSMEATPVIMQERDDNDVMNVPYDHIGFKQEPSLEHTY